MTKTTRPVNNYVLTSLFLLFSFLGISQNQTFTTIGSNSFTVPAGITSITVEAWGGGGRGGTRTSNGVGGGGGGGAYARKVLMVTPGTNYNVIVGSGSISSAAGEDSSFSSVAPTILLKAKGGNSALDNSITGAIGGASTSCIGDVLYSGGNGASVISSSTFSGGGGSSAGNISIGNNGTGLTGGIAPSGGGDGGEGKAGSAGNGSPGIFPGGGGGGAYRTSSTATGGKGANGQVIVWYGPQEIDIKGNFISIVDGDNIPSLNDWTDFGSTQILSAPGIRTFTIQNTGGTTLTIGAISFSGINPSDFTITTAPSTSLVAGGSTAFVVTFNPSATGTRAATISIANNDSNENPYNYSIQGIGIQTFFDSDGDGIYDNIDIDDDNDGIKDFAEEINCNNSNGRKVNYKFLNETFGTGTRTTINTTYSATSSYCYENAAVGTNTADCPTLSDISLNDGEYTVGSTAQIASWATSYWYMGTDHTGTANGRMAMFNADYTPGIFYTALITGALPNIPVAYSFWVLNLDRTDAPGIATRLRPNIKIEFKDINDVVLQTITTGDISPTTAGNLAGDWYQFTANLTFSVSTFKVIFTNNQSGGTGNDLAIDDIVITQKLCDLDNDGVPDLFDLDSDNDGIEDVIEAGLGNLSNGKGKIDVPWVDTNGNGLLDSAEPTANQPALDSDGDGVPNYLDLDSDNDSLFDVDESGVGNTNAASGYANGDGDINGDGTGDGLETEVFRSKDFDGNGTIEGFGDGILDIYDYGIVAGATTSISSNDFKIAYGNSGQGTSTANAATTYLTDTDGDGIPDYLDLKSNGSTFDITNTKSIYAYKILDTNNNGKIDGTTDIDKDGILDGFDTNTAYFGSPRDLRTKLFLDFDGRNDYGQSTAILGGLANASIMGWINLNSAFSSDGVILGQNNFQIRIKAGNKLEAVVNGNVAKYNTSLSPSQWYHIAAVYGGGNLKLYLNGQLMQTVAASGIITADASLFTLGKDPSTNTNYFKGKIDEVRIFNVALTNSQIQRMVYQEIDETSAQLRGTVVPKDIVKSSETAILFTNMLRYYRMDTYKDDIVDDLTTPSVDLLTGMKIYNHKNIYVQQAPMPFLTEQTGNFATAVNSTTKEIRGLDIMDYNWSIVKVQHDITEIANNVDLALFVDPGIKIVMNNNNKIQNDWYLKLDGKIDLQGKSQLLQTIESDLEPSSTGWIERDQQGQSNKYNYNYWSSPVSPINSPNNSNYTVAGVMKDGTTSTPRDISWIGGYDGASGNTSTPVSLARYWLYKFENNLDAYANWMQITETSLLRVGQGYTLKGSGASGNQNYIFVGKPNNGVINSNTVSANQLLLIGNPYPSALDAYAFINDNLSSVDRLQDVGVDGTLYFWEQSSSNNTHVLSNYLGGYAVLNLSGGIAPVAPSGISGIGLSGKIPKQYIPVGQGFFVYGKTGGGSPVIFNNGQRSFQKESDATSNTLFKIKPNYKNSKKLLENESDPVMADTIKRIRLGFETNNNYHRQVLLAFMEGKATSGIDDGYDGYMFDDFPNDMCLLNGEEQLVIEGESFFDASSFYPIGVKSDTEGKVQFMIDSLENFDTEQPIYIYDEITNIYHNIRNEAFEINLPKGENNTRFSLRFTDKTLGIADKTTSIDNGITVTFLKNENALVINNSLVDTRVKKVSLLAITGQSIISWKIEHQDQKNVPLPIKKISSGVYIAKIQTTKGDFSKKIIIP